MRTLVILITLGAITGAQGARGQVPMPARPAPVMTRPVTNSEPSTGIDGRVLNATTGEPLKKVGLVLRREDVSPNAHSPATYMTSTDESGRFVLSGIETGQYRLFGSRPGFVPTEFGSRSSAQPGVTLTIDAGQP